LHVDDSAFHTKLTFSSSAHFLERIAGYGDEIGQEAASILPRSGVPNRSAFTIRRALDCVERRIARARRARELLRVVAVRKTPASVPKETLSRT
jgi:hypothetical protein